MEPIINCKTKWEERRKKTETEKIPMIIETKASYKNETVKPQDSISGAILLIYNNYVILVA